MPFYNLLTSVIVAIGCAALIVINDGGWFWAAVGYVISGVATLMLLSLIIYFRD